MNSLQSKVKDFNHINKISLDSKLRTLDLSSEVGEVCKLAFSEGTGRNVPSEKWQEEVGDTLYSLLSLMNELGIDAEQTLALILAKYESRISRHGSSHSGN